MTLLIVDVNFFQVVSKSTICGLSDICKDSAYQYSYSNNTAGRLKKKSLDERYFNNSLYSTCAVLYSLYSTRAVLYFQPLWHCSEINEPPSTCYSFSPCPKGKGQVSNLSLVSRLSIRVSLWSRTDCFILYLCYYYYKRYGLDILQAKSESECLKNNREPNES